MGQTSVGLPKLGLTKQYQFTFDDLSSPPIDLGVVGDLVNNADGDFIFMQGLFAGGSPSLGSPISVQIAGTGDHASWNNLGILGGGATLSPNLPTTSTFLRYLLVSEVSEMFMQKFGHGWFESGPSGDEGSIGEALSRFIGTQFLIKKGLGTVPVFGGSTFVVGPTWLNSATRSNFIDTNTDDNLPDVITGCTTLFLWFLNVQLGFSINQIIAAGASTLAGCYTNLTGKTDGFSAFSSLINSHYPQVSPCDPANPNVYAPAGDNLFPVSDLLEWSLLNPPGPITCGYQATTGVTLTNPAMADLKICLTSDNPALVAVPPFVLVQEGASSAVVNVVARVVSLPIPPTTVLVHAAYAGKTITISIEVVSPQLTSLSLSPATVVCGQSSTAVVLVQHPPTSQGMTLSLSSANQSVAAVPSVPVVIKPHSSWAQFTVTTVGSGIAFAPKSILISASYSNRTVSAVLTVQPQVSVGIIASLSLSTTTVVGGGIVIGTVTLVEAVSTDTLVGLGASAVGSAVPSPQSSSAEASVPATVTIVAHSMSATFPIKTKPLVSPIHKVMIQITAAAVVEKYSKLTVIS
jgi:hypothetical protein